MIKEIEYKGKKIIDHELFSIIMSKLLENERVDSNGKEDKLQEEWDRVL